jgi:RIO kinase 1
LNLEAAWFEPFFLEGLITDVLAQLKSGKEASVFLCRGGAASGVRFVAVKSYRDRLHRNFHNRVAYQHGRLVKGSRPARAVATKTRFGRQIEEGMWIDNEFDALCRLHAIGADVPRPLAANESEILMEFVGAEDGPAPQLRELRPDCAEASRLFERLMWNIELFLANNVIHADLSAYNVLVRDGSPCIIDLPQAIDPRTNANACDLLSRDVRNLCRHFARLDVAADADRLSADLWQKFMRARL